MMVSSSITEILRGLKFGYISVMIKRVRVRVRDTVTVRVRVRARITTRGRF